MAVGLPVVATAASGVEILIEPQVNGHVVPTDDPAAFARALLDVCSNSARRLNMGQASLRRVRDFSVEAMVERTLDMYLRHRTP
jgi:glycosyltransferase involved in cell wall biosynthesis